jgi:probable F420-dependent oxidoreductase
MKVGATYPVIEMGGDPEAIRRFGLESERMNFDHILMYDHVLGAVHENRDPPFTMYLSEKHPLHDSVTCSAYLAGITKKIKFVFGILILPQRQVALVARQIADLSLLSGGRVVLGVGTGWNYVEYQALGVDWSARGKILDEQISVLRKLWSEDVVSFDGQFHQMDRVAVYPRPEVPVPIYMGGDSKVAFRRAARSGDGFIFMGPIENGLDSLAQFREIVEQEGRFEQEFGRHYFMVPVGVDPREGGSPKDGSRTVQAIIDELERWRDAGGTAASINTTGMGFTSVDQHLELMERVSTRLGL